ncbi:MAG: tetratricopeptide repeat protein, partial [Bacteroidota bacterium]
RVFGQQTISLHLINILFHLASVYLVYRFVILLNGKNISALIVAALFAVHPMHVESVAWISERKDVLYLFFTLLSLNAYIKYIRNYEWKFLAFSFLFFILALLSKSAAVVLPLLIILIDYYKNERIITKKVLLKIPFLLLSVLFGLLAIQSQGQVMEDYTTPVFPLMDRFFIASYNLLLYIVKFIIPFQLSAFHPYPIEPGNNLPWLFYISPIVLAILAILLLRVKQLKREVIFGLLFFFFGSILVIQLLPVGKAMFADRYSYLPFFGLAFIVGEFVTVPNLSRIKKALISAEAMRYIIIFVLVVFSVISWNRVVVWKNNISLWKDVVQKYPDHFYPHFAYASSLMSANDVYKALDEFNTSISLNSKFHNAYSQRALAKMYMNNIDGAVSDMTKAIVLKQDDATLYVTRGDLLEKIGDTVSAMNDYNKSIQLDPKLASAWYNRGSLLTNLNKLDDALRDFNQSIALDPLFADAYNNRGIVRYMKNDFSGAVNDYTEAIRLKPEDGLAYKNRGLAKLKLNDKNGACEDFTMAVNKGFKPAAQQIEKHCR